MSEDKILLEVNHLCASFFTSQGEVRAVNDVSYYVNRGEIVAIVGESGCGKSVTQMSSIQLIQMPPGKIKSGSVIFEGKDILKYKRSSKEMHQIRGANISFIFQEPMTSLNPVITVGKQIADVIRFHTRCSRKEAWAKGCEAFGRVGIPDPRMRMKNYPFEMSGGMRQRVMIAIALACNSKLVIADEPTTALDVTTQAQIMELLQELVRVHDKALIVVTHNLGLVTRYADRIYVMYAGKIIESGSTEDIIKNPRHPYTVGLLNSVPKLNAGAGKELVPIEGLPPSLVDCDDSCAFAPRCPYAAKQCRSALPVLRNVGENQHRIACHINIGE